MRFMPLVHLFLIAIGVISVNAALGSDSDVDLGEFGCISLCRFHYLTVRHLSLDPINAQCFHEKRIIPFHPILYYDLA
jgi:hypothetical protein